MMKAKVSETTGKKSKTQIKHFSIIIVSILLLSIFIGSLTRPEKETSRDGAAITELSHERTSDIERNFASMPGWFTENKGQIENPDVRFIYAASSCAVGFVESGYLLKITNEDNLTSVVRVSFDGSNPVAPEGKDELPHTSNYFIGNDSSKWRTGVPNYESAAYRNIYNGIDLVFYTSEKGLKYDFIVSPDAHSSLFPPAPGNAVPAHADICFSYEGVDEIFVDDSGNLHIATPAGELIEEAPFSYQVKDGKKVEVFSNFWTDGKTVGFEIGDYDLTTELIIDPLIYSTFVGGDTWDQGFDIVLDSENNAYITGWTYSPDFPTTSGCFDESHNGDGDVIVFKLNQDGSDLVYSTFVGGSDRDWGMKIAIDSESNTYITGHTKSDDFPTTSNCFDGSRNSVEVDDSYDVFVFKLNQDGSDLVYSTYLGGSSEDGGDQGKLGIAVDSENYAYVTGCTAFPDFPVTWGAYDMTYNDDGGRDAFVSKFNQDGSDLVYSTFLGGIYDDFGDGITLDSENCAYITGRTESLNFPTTSGCYDDSHNGNFDVFVSKFNSDGSDMVYSTYIGGDDFDWGRDIALDSDNNVYITGSTFSSDFPTTPGCFNDTHNGSSDGFVTKLNQDGSDLVYSTFVGGDDFDRGVGIALDSENNIYITGDTDSSNFPTTSGCFDDSHNGGMSDAIIFKLNHNCSTLVYSTYLGGSDHDEGCGIVVDSDNCVYVTGRIKSSDFPTTSDCYDNSHNGHYDACVSKLKLVAGNILPTVNITSPTHKSEVSGTVTISGSAFDGNGTIEKVEIFIDNGWTTVTGTDSWSYEWDTTEVEDGSHTIHARAFDGEVYSGISTIVVTVNNTGDDHGQSGDDGDDDLDGLWVIVPGAVIACAALGAFGYLKLKRKEEEEGDDERDRVEVLRCPRCGGETLYSKEVDDHYCWECKEYVGEME